MGNRDRSEYNLFADNQASQKTTGCFYLQRGKESPPTIFQPAKIFFENEDTFRETNSERVHHRQTCNIKNKNIKRSSSAKGKWHQTELGSI